ncbi:hypothetical protein GCM10023322_52570 [Rugosimonospora acidiphila]|uniref:DNA-3-methyladenine glycosylase II n=1 Tax=Rugosimonospora acidiphila TaxID=556531 RepID=A0ABP9S9M6_9ACTN
MTARDIEQAYATLAKRDRVLASLLQEYGPQEPFQWHDGGRTGSSQFAAMLLHIVGQKISAISAFAVYDRVASATDGIPTPTGVLRLGAGRLRACGLSEAKASYVLDFAQAQATGAIDIEGMEGLDDEQVVSTLTTVRGIGVWSAETFLIHNLRRPDVLPAGDLGLRRAVRNRWSTDGLPTVAELRAIGVAWSPYRSYAAALLWRSLRPVGELSDPKARALSRAASKSTPVGDT